MTVKVLTFGCRLNIYESGVIDKLAQESGLTNTFIFNSCAVTQEAERQVRQSIRKTRRDHPDAHIIVTGCAAQIHADDFAAMPEVTRVIGNDMKLKAEAYSGHEKILVNDIMSIKETAHHLVSSFEGKARAFIEVQNGCDHRCTFCQIPYGRGNSRSVPLAQIVNHVRLLVEEGFKEVVLTGVDITSYGSDLPGTPTLGQMIKRLFAQVPHLPRLRLSSLDPVEIDEDIFSLAADEPRLLPHFHLSVQAGDDMILKRMKRRHLRHHIIDVCTRFRSINPAITFGADLIAGFPTETDEMFANTLALIKEADLTFLHVFPYSPLEKTPSSKMPQVPKALRKERAQLLREEGERSVVKKMKEFLGQSTQVLVERDGFGYSSSYFPVQVQAPCHQIATVRLTGIKNNQFIGEVI